MKIFFIDNVHIELSIEHNSVYKSVLKKAVKNRERDRWIDMLLIVNILEKNLYE